jgi:putative glutamine amidotransferase
LLRIGLSWHGAKPEYDAYEHALLRRADELGIPVSIVWLAGSNRPFLADAISSLDGICFTGGEDVEPWRYGRDDAAPLCKTNPKRDAIEWQILKQLQRRSLPLLAICRGAQLLNVFNGGTLMPDLAERNSVHCGVLGAGARGQRDRGHSACRTRRLGSGVVNSSHHQAVESLAPGFQVCAQARDRTIEAFERASPGTPVILAVQWHPELMPLSTPLSKGVPDALLERLIPKVPRAT